MVISFVFLVAGFFLGRKYQELMDLMLARRISKLITQKNKIADEQVAYEKYCQQDEKLSELMQGTYKYKVQEEKVIDY